MFQFSNGFFAAYNDSANTISVRFKQSVPKEPADNGQDSVEMEVAEVGSVVIDGTTARQLAEFILSNVPASE